MTSCPVPTTSSLPPSSHSWMAAGLSKGDLAHLKDQLDAYVAYALAITKEMEMTSTGAGWNASPPPQEVASFVQLWTDASILLIVLSAVRIL